MGFFAPLVGLPGVASPSSGELVKKDFLSFLRIASLYSCEVRRE